MDIFQPLYPILYIHLLYGDKPPRWATRDLDQSVQSDVGFTPTTPAPTSSDKKRKYNNTDVDYNLLNQMLNTNTSEKLVSIQSAKVRMEMIKENMSSPMYDTIFTAEEREQLLKEYRELVLNNK